MVCRLVGEIVPAAGEAAGQGPMVRRSWTAHCKGCGRFWPSMGTGDPARTSECAAFI